MLTIAQIKLHNFKRFRDLTLNVNPDINIFRIQSRFVGKLLKKKKTIFVPEVENRKFIDNLTSQIEEIDNVKKYLLKSYKRSLKKNT